MWVRGPPGALTGLLGLLGKLRNRLISLQLNSIGTSAITDVTLSVRMIIAVLAFSLSFISPQVEGVGGSVT